MAAMLKLFRNALFATAACAGLFLLASPVTLRAQSYYFSAAVNGYQEVPFGDPNNPNSGPFGGRYPGFNWDVQFGTLNGTLIYNSAEGTMEMMGTLGINPVSYNGSFKDNQNVNGSYVTASVTVNSGVANPNNGTMSFDSGVVSHMNGQNNQWEISMQVPITGTYSLATGGQTYNGSFTETLTLPTYLNMQSVDANSLTFSQNNASGTESGGATLAQVTADNGVKLTLASIDPSDGQTYATWQLNNVNATAPEPGTTILLIVGLVGLGISNRRR
jgi:hypothetical protein